MFKAVRYSADSIVCLLKSFYTDADTDLWIFFAERNYSVCKITVSGNDDTVRLVRKYLDYVLDILSEKRLPSRDVCEFHLGKFSYHVKRYLPRRICGVLVDITHIAMCITSVCDYYCSV